MPNSNALLVIAIRPKDKNIFTAAMLLLYITKKGKKFLSGVLSDIISGP
jgi:hypothetical protein